MIQVLNRHLPTEYAAEPRVHLGTLFEDTGETGGGATWAPPQPTLTCNAGLTEQYEYEVLIYDRDRNRQLVAAIEIVSPANKDRPESRQAFVSKCAALLQERVCVSIVDLVTTRNFNLYTGLLHLIDRTDPTFTDGAAIYAVTCRGRKVEDRPRLETWAYPLVSGQALPVLPIWLTETLAVPLDLEASYEDACKTLRIA